MNKIIKILLSVMIVFLSALVVPLKTEDKSTKIEPVTATTVQTIAVKSTENNIKEHIKEVPVSINFEIDIAIEEMNQKMVEIECIDDRKEWFIAYKNITDKYSYIIDPPESIYDYFTDKELDLLFHVVQAEVGDEYSFEQKTHVASVIFNRLWHEKFPGTLSEILTPDQFQPISDGRYKSVNVSEDTILSCEYAFQIQDTTEGCLFFDSNNVLNYKFVFSDGAHNFYRLR